MTNNEGLRENNISIFFFTVRFHMYHKIIFEGLFTRTHLVFTHLDN